MIEYFACFEMPFNFSKPSEHAWTTIASQKRGLMSRNRDYKREQHAGRLDKDLRIDPSSIPPYVRDVETIRGNDNRLLVGITGGIATGKTTVANLLMELGVAHIDYDLLARKVVEPGKAAWEDILAYCGSQVLNTDQSVDRKKLGSIVFQDPDKRRKLESFTHPRIHEQFVRQVHEIAEKSPGSIIQVSIPLMIEQNLQSMFHKLVVVYVSEEQQIERLISRDRMSEADARAILNAQLSIEEKVGYADYVIQNGGSIEDTKKQVEALLKALQDVQKGMSGKTK